ncbi:MAG: hypothetical protein ACYCVW_16505 [Rhodocyclaceae bacterium]
MVDDRGGRIGLVRLKKRRNPIARRHRRHHAVYRRRHHARRNPIGRRMSGGGFWSDVLTGTIAFPVAALATDVVYGYMPIPTSMQTGIMRPIGKLAIAALLGLGAKFALPRRMAVMAAAGAMGGVIYDSAKSYLTTNFPTLPLSGMGAMSFAEVPYQPALPASAEPSYLGNASEPDYLGAYLEGTGSYLTNEAA